MGSVRHHPPVATPKPVTLYSVHRLFKDCVFQFICCVKIAPSRRVYAASLQRYDWTIFRAMASFKSDIFFSLFLLLIFIQSSNLVSAIRKDVGLRTFMCRNTVQGRYLLSDDNGYVCDALSVDPESRCCPQKGEQFSCHGCNLVSQCCDSYEYCVSCCLGPSQTRKELALQVKIAKPVTAGTYSNVFDYCSGRCRHNSASVVHENAYLSDLHHCFSLPTNSTGSTDSLLEARLVGISILVGRKGESCESVCKSSGQSCVLSKLPVLSQCEIMQKHMSCRGGCLASLGSDQPAEVVDGAPRQLYPGACLYTKMQAIFSCDGSHQHTRRLCPCA